MCETIATHILKQMKGELTIRKIKEKQLAKWKTSRNIGEKILEGIPNIKAGRVGRRLATRSFPIVRAREKAALSQAQFAGLLGVSLRTLPDWEQRRLEPTVAAKTLIKVAELHQEIPRKIAA